MVEKEGKTIKLEHETQTTKEMIKDGLIIMGIIKTEDIP